MKNRARLLSLVLVLALIFSGCESPGMEPAASSAAPIAVETATPSPTPAPTATLPPSPVSVDLASIPAYEGAAYVEVNGNAPYFTEDNYTEVSFESYSELDSLGRCGTAFACIGEDIMPTEERGEIGQVKPSGWHTVRYGGIVDGNYLYNRCHLIGYQLSGEKANTQNLITGTRYLNIEGMLPFENMVADYVKETKNHVLYRVTPVFDGDNLLANGVLLEGRSMEDGGAGISFCVFAYNVQPSIRIDYTDGESTYIEPAPAPEPEQAQPVGMDYILNTNTGKFHRPGCSSVDKMKEANKQHFTGTRDEVAGMGYEPCKRCNP